MSRSSRTLLRTAALAAAALLLPGGAAAAQLINPVCAETCPDPVRFPVEAAACLARQQACTSKVTLYHTYMAQLGLGTTRHALPARYVQILQPHFPGATLGNWRFAFGDRQPPMNATTDCSVTYFNNQDFVHRLVAGELTSSMELGWLFHELRHFVQCMQQPGRDRYARMWFNQLELTFLQNSDLASLHDRMPMEGDAAAWSTRVLDAVRTRRDVNGRLVLPIRVALASTNGPVTGPLATRVGSPQRFTAQVSGGSNPLEREWRWRQPGQTTFADGQALVRNGAFEFTPDRAGTYEVRLRVGQPGSNLIPASATVQIRADPPLVVATGTLTATTSPVTTATPTRLATGSLTVRALRRTRLDPTLRPLGGATVTLGTSTNATAYGSRQTASDGTARFDNVPLASTQSLLVAVSKTLCGSGSAQYTPTSSNGSVQVTLTCAG